MFLPAVKSDYRGRISEGIHQAFVAAESLRMYLVWFTNFESLLLSGFFIPPYSRMGGYLVYCVFLIFLFVIFCLFFVCTVMDLSAAEKGMGTNFWMHVGLLSREFFSPFGEFWPVGSHGGCILCGSWNWHT